TTLGGQNISDDGTATINDSDDTPTITSIDVTNTGDQVVEGGILNYEVTITGTSSVPTTFDLELNGDAEQGTDYGNLTFTNNVTYNPQTGQITVPAGVTSFIVNVPTIDDFFAEETESVILEIGGQSATGNIVDDNDTVNVSLSGPTQIIEGQTATYTITLDQPATPGSIINISYSFAGGATTSDIIETTQATVGANGTTITFDVVTVDDSLNEVGEEYTVSITSIELNGSDLFEDLDVSGASVTTAIIDETGNSPVGPLVDRDFSIGPDPSSTGGAKNTTIAGTDGQNVVITGSVIFDFKNTAGSTIGLTLKATDPDSSDTVTYSLTDSYNGLFTVDPNTGVVTLTRPATAADINNQEWDVITITGQATSSDGSTSEATFNITISNWATFSGPTITPLIIDLDGDGVNTISINEGIEFDIDADGTKERVGWASAGDALLAIDLNGDGVINDGSELFGEASPKPVDVEDGFQALSVYDENNDGVLDANDSAYDDIIVWQDKNSDGVSQADEMVSLSEAGVASIDLTPEDSFIVDNGNLIGLQSTWTDNDGQTHAVDDVWLQVDEIIDTNVVTLGGTAGVAGSAEADRFVVDANSNTTKVTIEDFTIGEDHIDLSDLLEGDQLSAIWVSEADDQVTINIDMDGDQVSDHEIVLDNISLSDLNNLGGVINTLFDSETTALITSDEANVVVDTASVLVEIDKDPEL
ncbi:hypothetical protein CS022_21285, partial [Veronia nyctiphanis]